MNDLVFNKSYVAKHAPSIIAVHQLKYQASIFKIDISRNTNVTTWSVFQNQAPYKFYGWESYSRKRIKVFNSIEQE